MTKEVKDKIYLAAKESSHKRFPPMTPQDASRDHGYRMEHGLGFEYGAKFGYSLVQEEIEKLKAEKDDLYNNLISCANTCKELKAERDELKRCDKIHVESILRLSNELADLKVKANGHDTPNNIDR